MLDLLVRQPMLLLFLVLAAGYAVGRLSIGGVQLGMAAVLFAGLAAGMLDPRLAIPEFARSLGLVIFVYAIGIASGPGFVASLRRRGLRNTAWTLALLTMAAGLAAGLSHLTGFGPAITAGLFCGALTNTPALAAVLERLPSGAHDPVVGYSIAYPVGVLGLIVGLAVARRRWRSELAAMARRGALEMRFVLVTQAGAIETPVRRLLEEWGIRARFVRRRQAGSWSLLHPDTGLERGDLVTVVGSGDDLDRLVARVGEVPVEPIEVDRGDLELRRIFVSNRALAGRSLAELRTLSRFGALVTRLRRGDADLVPDGRTVLELGDRVRVVAHRDRMAEVSRFFGDSYRALAEVDVMSFGLGAALGMLLGLVSVPLPGGAYLRLGPAGGPLVMGIVLGALGRTGPVLWQLPYSGGLTLRQLGLALFLASVGVSAGMPFRMAIGEGDGMRLLAVSAAVALVTVVLALVTGRRMLGTSPGAAMGIVSGVMTQPAGLAFAEEASGDGTSSSGYASVSPVATITKIILAQVLLGPGIH